MPHLVFRALKAFVNERRPHTAPRKPPRTKKPPQNQTPYPYDIDITQESSSQSSSAENGEPQTPSPHYSESLANTVPQVEGQDSAKPGTSDIPLDPHFVRLLSSLTMSASKSKGSEDVQKHTNIPLSVDTNQHDNKESSTPVPISASSIGCHPVDRTDWSTSVPKRFTPLPHFRDTTSTPLSTEATHPSHHPPLSITQNSHPRSIHPFNEAGVRHPQSPHPTPFPSTHVPSSPTNTVVSARSTSRRASSITDISPYISRPTEIPTSAKTLKQIALLEAVADESARMNSLVFREPPTNLHGTRYSRHSGTPSVPPPSLVPHDYSISRPSLSSDLPYGPYHIRSRTSHAFHPIPPTHLGGAENHLLGLMNSPRTTSQVPYLYPHVQHTRPVQAGAIPASPYPFPVTATPEIPRYHGLTNITHHNPNSLLSVLNDSRRRSGV